MAEKEAEKKTTLDYVNEIWNIADYVRDAVPRADYNKVVLPFALLRRLECALEPTRDKVCEAVKKHEADWGRENDNYCQFSGKAFYNTTKLKLGNINADKPWESLETYINGFSPNAREILQKFDMEHTCKDLLQAHNLLYGVCEKFSEFPFYADVVSDRDMSDIYEHLIERYGDEIAEDAEDFMTPKDVVRLAVKMIFANDDELLSSDRGDVRTLYDPSAGTCGFITDALDLLDEWREERQMQAPVTIVPYGEELSGVTWAMGKANILLRNVSNGAKDRFDMTKDISAHIENGDTLMDDKFEGETFNYILSNPPYGKKWEKQKDAVEEEAAAGFAGRFGAGLPAIGDGSMLFLQNVVHHMKTAAEGGGKAGIVLSASPLFNGDAGSGPSNIRRWLFQQDVIDCIVKLPKDIFFRTGINTYLWILNTKKPEGRKGMIQLIDGSELGKLKLKSQGNKRMEITEEQMDWVARTYVDGHNGGKSILVPCEDFLYRKVTVERPLRLVITFDMEHYDEMYEVKSMQQISPENKAKLKAKLEIMNGQTVKYKWFEEHQKEFRAVMDKPGVTQKVLSERIVKAFGVRTESDEDIVYDAEGNIVPDPKLEDTENVPWGMAIEDYMVKEVLPYLPDTWVNEDIRDSGPLSDGEIGVVGTQISFDKYFYHYEAPREPSTIMSEIEDLEKEIEQALAEVHR